MTSALGEKNIEKEESYRKKNKELFVRKQTKKITPILPTISISPRMHYLTFEKKNLLLDCNTERQPKLDTIILIKYITKF